MTHLEKSTIQSQIADYFTLWREMIIVYEDYAKAHSVSYTALLVLYSLFETPEGCTQKDICTQWLFPKQTVNTLLKEYTARNYIQMTACGDDRRNKKVRLTEAGLRYAEPVIVPLQQLEISVMQKMGSAKREALLTSTALFLQYFKEGV